MYSRLKIDWINDAQKAREVPLMAALLMPSSVKAATADFFGNWNTSTTYSVGKVVKYNGATFYSRQSTTSSPSRNRIPSANPTWWEQVGTIGIESKYADCD